MVTKYKLDRSAHSVYSLNYHLILVVKYRRPVLKTEIIKERLKEIIWNLQDKTNVEIIMQEPDIDHIHILFKSKPIIDLSKVINTLKGVSARYLRQEFPELKKYLWGDSFWSNSYFLATTGQVSLSILKKYVESQGREK